MFTKRLAALLTALFALCFFMPALAAVITLPSGLTEITKESFLGTTSAELVVLPEGVTAIGARAFAGSSLRGVVLPDSIESIAADAFDDTALEYVVCGEDNDCARDYFAVLGVPCEAPYPADFKSVYTICPWGAGGSTDAILRAFNVGLGEALDATVVVDNTTGSGGINGHQAIADAEPDGYTLGMVTFELSTYQPLGTSGLTYADYDPLCLINTDAAAVIVNSEWAAANGIAGLADFIAYCAKHPGEVKLGGASTGSVWHIAGGYLMEQTGIRVAMVNYASGAADAVKAAAMGEIQGTTVSLIEARAFIESGHLLCLGVMSDMRDPALPDAPTCAEAGYDLHFGTFRGLALPKGVSGYVRSILGAACEAAARNSEFASFMASNRQAITYLNSDDFGAYLEKQAKDVIGAMEILGLIDSAQPEPEPEPGELIDYPHSSVTMINPWAAGGGTDALLRAFSQAMERQMTGTTITVDNITGAGGINGHQAIADVDTDGSEMGMITFELSTYAPLDMADLTYADYDPLCLINTDAAAVIVNSEWAAANGIAGLDDFIAYCAKHPGEVKLGCASTGSVWHIACGYLMDQTGIRVQPMNYASGAATAVQAAAMGEVQGVTVSVAEARSFIETGNLRCLGVMDSSRSVLLPDAPTCKEAGYDLEFGTFRGLALPKGTDAGVKSMLESICAAAIRDEEFVSFVNNSMGWNITYLCCSDFTAYLKKHADQIISAMEIIGLL